MRIAIVDLAKAQRTRPVARTGNMILSNSLCNKNVGKCSECYRSVSKKKYRDRTRDTHNDQVGGKRMYLTQMSGMVYKTIERKE